MKKPEPVSSIDDRTPSLSRSLNNVTYIFMDLDELEIAQQLTLMHFETYVKIKVNEFIIKF